MKFEFVNDTGRKVGIHPATLENGVKVNTTPIEPLEIREFILPDGTYPWMKLWDYGERGLSILISPQKDE